MTHISIERAAIHNSTRSRLDLIIEIDPKSLGRDDLPDGFRFSELVPFFQQLIGSFRELSSRNLSTLPLRQYEEIENAASNLMDHIKSVQTFSLSNDAITSRNRIVAGARSAFEEILNQILLPLAFTATQDVDLTELDRQKREVLATLESTKKETLEVLQAIKTQAAELGVSQNEQLFRLSAAEWNGSAWWWMIGTLVSIAVASLLAVVFLVYPGGMSMHSGQQQTVPQAINFVFSKALLFSIAFFAMVMCVKNFRSAKHNETLNKHRADALSTFRTFVHGASDASVRDAILLHAAQAAFSCRNTGFETGDSDTVQVQPIIDVLGKTLLRAPSSSGSP